MPELVNPNDRPRLAICVPGNSYSWQWMFYFVELFPYLLNNFRLNVNFSSGCNIYEVRNGAANTVLSFKEGVPDYVLWIDSDNCVTVDGFCRLKDALDKIPEACAVGAWYTYLHQDGTVDVAAGTVGDQAQHPKVYAIRSMHEGELMEVDYIGFGFLLMRGEALKALGKNPFKPMAMENTACGFEIDDVAFCRAAREKGYKFFLHPKVNAPHLKLLTVPIDAD